MQSNKETISPAEWEVMRVVWTLSSVKTSTIIQLMQEKMGWQASTTKTLLARLTKKEFLVPEKQGRVFCYHAKISEEVAIDQAAQALFSNICSMRVGSVLNKLLNEVEISKFDIKKLQQTLVKKAKTAPEQINCDCLPCE
jgi:CopY/TcrY family copper transport repressor